MTNNFKLLPVTLSLFISLSLQHQTIHVTPGQRTSNESQASYTIEDFLERASDYLVSNTTVLFYPGLHQIQQPLGNILIQSVENLSLEGKTSTGVLIHCNNNLA